ncbi:MAG: hypothetical protein ALAOOOJD_03189 [bacterium]|nr:hypothetical protein [bacterium]
MRKMALIFYLLVLWTLPLNAQENVAKDFSFYWRQAQKSYHAKDYPAYFENMKGVVQFRPDNPNMKYNFAGAHALVGKPEAALSLLAQLADMGLIYDPAADADFNSLKESEEFKDILQKFTQNQTPVGQSAIAFKLPEKDLITESVAFDPQTATYFVSSVHKRKIVSLNAKGESKDFATRQAGLWSVLGMKVDAPRGILWACSAVVPEMQGFQKEEEGYAGVFKFEAKTGRLIKSYILSNQPQAHVFGDLAISGNGDVYISDSVAPVLYRITREKDELELFLTSELFRSLQGVTFSTDEKYLFVADYSVGLLVVDVAARQVKKIAAPANVAFTTVDGMYFYKNSLIAIQNGINPQRVVRFFLNQSFDRIERAEVIAANQPLFNEPTLGLLLQDTFYFIANSQWGSFTKDKMIFPLEKLQEPVILKTRLE